MSLTSNLFIIILDFIACFGGLFLLFLTWLLVVLFWVFRASIIHNG